MKAVLIIASPDSEEAKSLCTFLPHQGCSYQQYTEKSTIVAEHIGSIVFFEKIEDAEKMQKLFDMCQTHGINVVSTFGFDGIKIPQQLNYSLRVLEKNEISNSSILSLLKEMNQKSA